MIAYQYQRGVRYLQDFTHPDDPVDPATLPDGTLLHCLGVNGEANRSIVEATSNDVFALRTKTEAELKALPGVRGGMVRKLHALFDLVDMFENPRKRSRQRDALAALLLKRPETDLVLAQGGGDVFNLAGRDHADLLAVEGIGPATVAKLFALLELVRRGVVREGEGSSPIAA